MESEIGNRIKQRRKEKKLTQKDIEKETGISSGNISDIENGNKLPSSNTIISLSKILECSTDYILKGYKNEDDTTVRNELERDLLQEYRKLPRDEQEELYEITKIKVKKINK